MGKITLNFETKFDVDNIVAFEKNDRFMIGIVTGYYYSDNNIWYNIQVDKDYIFTYMNGGDIHEEAILFKLTHDQVDEVKRYAKYRQWEITDKN